MEVGLEKARRFKNEWATTADPAAKFQLEKAIEQARADLVKLDSWSWSAGPSPRHFDANPAARALFVSRQVELERLATALLCPAPRPVALVGMPGVGKSYLADHFAFLHSKRFHGGYLRLVLDPAKPPASVTAWLGDLADRLKVAPEPAADLAERIATRLKAPLSLLHVENVDGLAAGQVAAEIAQRLPGCPLIVSGRFQCIGIAAAGGWEHIEVALFKEAEAFEHLNLELGDRGRHVSHSDRWRLVENLSYLPLAVHLAAGYLRAGQTVDGFLEELCAAKYNLPPADPADPVLAAREDRVLIANTYRISLALLGRQLARPNLLIGLYDLGFAPASGFGESLGAELAGQAAEDFRVLVSHAKRLSLIEQSQCRGRPISLGASTFCSPKCFRARPEKMEESAINGG